MNLAAEAAFAVSRSQPLLEYRPHFRLHRAPMARCLDAKPRMRFRVKSPDRECCRRIYLHIQIVNAMLALLLVKAYADLSRNRP